MCARLLNLICGVTVILFSISLAAQDDDTLPKIAEGKRALSEMSLQELGDIEVTTTSKTPEQLWQTPAAVFVLTKDDIRRSGATTIPELLRLVPGVEVARTDSNHWVVGIRGFGSIASKAVLVLIDGRNVYSPLFAGTYWDVQDTLLQDIERIEVIRGPGGTIWGANAVSGVINIITKHTSDTEGWLATAGSGSLDQASAAARYGGNNGRGLHYRIYGKTFSRSPLHHEGSPQYDDWRQTRGGFRMDVARASDKFTFQGDIYKGESGERATLHFINPPETRLVFANNDLAGGNLQARWQRTLSEASDLQLQFYYDRTSRNRPQFSEALSTYDLDFLHRFVPFARNQFVWGAGMRFADGRVLSNSPTLAFTPADRTDKTFTGFIQDEITIIRNRLTFQAGAKLEHNSYSGFEVQPNARLLFRATPNQTFWLAATRALRTPTRLEEDIELDRLAVPGALPIFVRISGNRNFEPETLVSYEAGYRRLFSPQLYVDIAVYRARYDKLLGVSTATTFVETTPPPPRLIFDFPLANVSQGHGTGAEIAPDFRLSNWWRLRASYSYLNLNLRPRLGFNDNGISIMFEGSSPRHQVRTQTSLDLPRGFELDLFHRFVDTLKAAPIDAYHSVNLRAGWRYRDIDISVVGENLLRPHHLESSSSSTLSPVENKRNIFVRLTWSREN